MLLSVEYMKLTDRVLLEHFKKSAVENQVHVVYQKVADNLSLGRNTVYRSVNRLRAAGHLKMVTGSDSVGYTYQINITE